MSAIRKLIEMARAESLGPTDDAEAELKVNEAWYDHLNAEVDKLRVQLAERDRADAELLKRWRHIKNNGLAWVDVVDTLERWAAAKGGGK